MFKCLNPVKFALQLFNRVNVKMNKGFTILEVIAAIFVMTVGVLGAYTAVQQIIVYTSISSSRLTAAYLAQEGIEFVRNIRDSNWVDNNPATDWNNSISSREETVGFLDETTSKFTRKITITPVGDYKLKVSVEITWPGDAVTVEEHLYNWY